ncbi:MAG: ion channel [Terriglobia bacterium]
MIFQKQTEQIRRVWARSDSGSYLEDSLLMRTLITAVIASGLLSLSSLKEIAGKESSWRRNFMDLYVPGWLGCLLLILYLDRTPHYWTGWVAAYRVAELVHYRIYFLLVKGWDEPWLSKQLRRSLMLALLTAVQIVIAYAILFRTFARIGPPETQFSDIHVLSRSQSIYFSAITFTTAGFGDMVPLDGPSQMLIVTELAAGFITLVVLVPLVLAGFATGLHRNEPERSRPD